MTEYKLCREHVREIGKVADYLGKNDVIRVTPAGYVEGLGGCTLCKAEHAPGKI